MKKTLEIVASIFLLAVSIGVLGWLFYTCDSEVRPARAEEYRFRSLDIIATHLSLLEKPDLSKVYLADEEAERFRPYFEHAGLSCASNGTAGVYGLVFVGGKGPHDWKALAEKTSDNGSVAWFLDIRGMTAAQFKRNLTAFPCAATHVWMPGENDWLLTGRMTPRNLKLDVMLDLFSPEGATEDLVQAECESFPELFASYVGTREDILPAFQGDLEVPVRPECFMTKDIPALDWIVRGGAEEDIWSSVMQEIRSMQVIRRVIIEGNMLALQKGSLDEAIDKWAAAILRNPHDIMLLDRLYRLAVNGRAFEKLGNLKGAVRCYETMIAVRPRDAATMRRYAECMRMLGRADVADAAEKKAKELEK